MYQAYYKKQRRKSIIIITFLVLFSLISTYLIYEKFANSRDKDYDTGKMEVVFLDKFTPVTDAIGLSSPSYTFTVINNTDKKVKYSIKLVANKKKMEQDNCDNKQIPKELLKLSFRKDHLPPVAYVLSEFPNDVIYEDSLKPNSSEDYSIRLWAMNSNFTLDKTSHYHALIEVIEE